MFNRLYFDTSELVASGWPRLSADLENVLRVIRSANIAAFIPIGVEIELERKWHRELTERISKAKSAAQAVEAHFDGVRDVSVPFDLPDGGGALDEYRRAVEELKGKHGMRTVPFTARPLSEIFEMAALRHPPFKQGKDDVGFRDAVIFLSVVDDLVAAKGQVGALVSRDDAFHDPKVVEFATRAGAQLQLFRSVEMLFDSLMHEVADYVGAQWKATTADVQRRLQARLHDIEKFITDTLEVPEWGFGLGTGVIAVPRIDAIAVVSVRLPIELRSVERVRWSFDVQAKLHVKIERWLNVQPPRKLRVGPEETVSELLASLKAIDDVIPAESPIFSRPTENLEVLRLMRVEASSDPKYQEFTFESASLVVEGVGGMSVGL